MAKNMILMVTIMLIVMNNANAFLYENENAVWWGGGTGDWMTESNWTDYGAVDWRIPGWVSGHPDNDGSWTSTSNMGYACIESGVVNITTASYPDGQVYRSYIGGPGEAALNVGADTSWGRFYTGWDPGETGIVSLVAGSMAMNSDNFYLGYNGDSRFYMSSGVLNAGKIHVSSGDSSTSHVEISGGMLNAAKYLAMESGTATLNIIGSGSTISVGRFQADAGESHILSIGLDADGVTAIDVFGNLASGDSYEGATLNDLVIQVNALPGFSGGVGSMYDIMTSATFIEQNGLNVVSNISGLDFDWAIVSDGNNEILRLTAVPEPMMILLLGIGGVVAKSRRKN